MNEERKEELNGNEESGISIRDIFRIIGKKIWYVLAGTLIVTIATVLVFMFAINPAKQSQSMSFRIDYPMSSAGKYPDGSMFDYRDIASREVIEAAKNNPEYKDEFASVDVDKVMKEGGVTVSARQTSEESDAAYIYTVSLKNSCFDGVNAKRFIEALTDAFTAYVGEKADKLNYELDAEIFNNASFEDQLFLLTEQKTVITQRYEELIKEYSAGHVVGGKSLGSYRMEVVTMLADTIKTPIENDLTTKGYEYFNKTVNGEKVKIRVQQLQEELKLDRAVLEELKRYYTDVSAQSEGGITPYAAVADDNNDSSNNSGSNIIIMPGDSNLSQRMAYYSERYAIVKQQLVYLTSESLPAPDTEVDEDTDVKDYNFDAMAEEIKAFGDRLSDQFKILNERANTLTNTIGAIYDRDTLVTFTSGNADSEGGASLAIVAIAALVVSFVVFAVIAFFVGKKNIKSQKSGSAPAEEKAKTEE